MWLGAELTTGLWSEKSSAKGPGFSPKGSRRFLTPRVDSWLCGEAFWTGLTLDPLGWKIVLEVVVKTRARVTDVPIVFADREEGESKLGLKAQVDYLRHLGRLYAFRYPLFLEFVKFCLVGLTGLVVDTAVLVSLVDYVVWIRGLQPSLLSRRRSPGTTCSTGCGPLNPAGPLPFLAVTLSSCPSASAVWPSGSG